MRAFRAVLSRVASRLAQLALPTRHLTGKTCRVLAFFLGGLTVGLLATAANASYTNVQFVLTSPTGKVTRGTFSPTPTPPTLVVGQNVTFQMTASNLYVGPSARPDWADLEAIPAGNTWVSAYIPFGTTFVSFSAAPGWTCAWQNGTAPPPSLPPVGSVGGAMSCYDPDPFRGVAQFSLTVQITSPGTIPGQAPGTILGQAQLTLYSPSFVNRPATLAIATRNGPPTVSSVAPAMGPSTYPGGPQYLPYMVTITGTGFTGATSITIGGNPLEGTTITSTTITGYLTPNHAPGPASVVVTTPLGSNPASPLFTFLSPP
jgi:IPT/TIG domain